VKKRVSKLAISAVACVAALALLEIGLRFTLPEANRWFIWPPGLETRFEIDPALFPGVGHDARVAIDSLGLRGAEIPADATLRVIALGGSTTECLYLDQSKTWPALLERALDERDARVRAWVGNAGRSGHTLRENILQLEELGRSMPRIDVVLVLPGINDLSKRLAQGDAYDPDMLSRAEGREALMHSAFSVHPLSADTDAPMYKRTALWRLASRIRRRFEAGSQSVLGENAHVYDVWRAHRRGATRWIDALPDLSRALEEYKRNLEQLVDIAEQARARIVLATQPMLWRADLPASTQELLWMGGTGDFQHEAGMAYYTLPALIEGMRRYNDVVRAVARERHVECVDLASQFDGDTSVFYDDCHFTEAGARRVADAWASVLTRARAGPR
jgi:lysophospholipase L1-like esterase